MARNWPLALAVSLIAGAAAAQEDPIGDLLGGPSLPAAAGPETTQPAPAPAPQPPAAQSPAPAPTTEAAPPPQIPAASQPELDEEGQVIAPPAPSESTPTPPPAAAANPLSQPVPPAAARTTPPVQAAYPPPQPAPAAPSYAPPAYAPPPAAVPPAYVAPPVASTPATPVPYGSLAPSTPPPPAYSSPPAAPYPPPSASYASPASPYATTPPPPPAYSSPALGVASAPPPSTGVQSRARTPVYVDEHGRTPDAAPNYREIDYEQRLRSSYASAQGLQGPMDGGWTLAIEGDDRYLLQLVERSSGLLEGAWRDLRRSGAVNATGFVEGIQRYGGQLTFSFRPDPRDEMATVTLNAGAEGKWSGEMVRGRDRKPITLRRN